MSLARTAIAFGISAALSTMCLPAVALTPQKAVANEGEPFTVENTTYGIEHSSITGKKITLAEGVTAVDYEEMQNQGQGFLVLQSGEEDNWTYEIVNAKGEVAKRFVSVQSAPELKLLTYGRADTDNPSDKGLYFDTLYTVDNPESGLQDLYNSTRGTYIEYGARSFGQDSSKYIPTSSCRHFVSVFYSDPDTGYSGIVACDGTKVYGDDGALIETSGTHCRGYTASGIAIYEAYLSNGKTNVLTSNGSLPIDAENSTDLADSDCHNCNETYFPSSGSTFYTRERVQDGDLVVLDTESNDQHPDLLTIMNARTGETVFGPGPNCSCSYAGSGAYAITQRIGSKNDFQYYVYIVSPKYGAVNCATDRQYSYILGTSGGYVYVYACNWDSDGDATDSIWMVFNSKGNVVSSTSEGCYQDVPVDGNVAIVCTGQADLPEADNITSYNYKLKFLKGAPADPEIEDIVINPEKLGMEVNNSYTSPVVSVERVTQLNQGWASDSIYCVPLEHGLIIVQDIHNKHYLIDTIQGKILLEDLGTDTSYIGSMYTSCPMETNSIIIYKYGDEFICSNLGKECEWGILNRKTGAFTGYVFSGSPVSYDGYVTLQGITTDSGGLWVIDDTLYAFQDGEIRTVRENVSGEYGYSYNDERILRADGYALFKDGDVPNSDDDRPCWFASSNGTISANSYYIYYNGYQHYSSALYAHLELLHDPAYRVIDPETGKYNLVSLGGTELLDDWMCSISSCNHRMFYAEETEGDYDVSVDYAPVRTAGLLNVSGDWILHGEYWLPKSWTISYYDKVADAVGESALAYPGIDQTLAMRDAEDENVFYLYDMTQYVNEGYNTEPQGPAAPDPAYVSGKKNALLFTKLYNHDYPSVKSHEFSWDDRWLMASSSTYNSKLAIASMIMSWSAYNNTRGNKYKFIKRFFSALQLYDVDTSAYKYRVNNEDSDYENGFDLVGYGFGHRTSLDSAGNPVELLFVAVRGTPGNDEWSSNANVSDLTSGTGYKRFHEGFRNAEYELAVRLDEYCKKHSIDTANTRILISGHSRGAAVANLLAASLQEHMDQQLENLQGFTKGSVYAYTFATPAITTDNDAYATKYNNIFNIVNPEDFVPRVPLSAWGFKRYGKTFYLPSKSTEHGKFSAYIGRLQRLYKDNYDVEYQPFTSGTGATDGMVNNAKSIAPTLEKFYKEDPAWKRALHRMYPTIPFVQAVTNSMSFREFFGHLTAYLGRGDNYELLEDLGAILQDLIGAKTKQASVLAYFATHYKLDSCIEHAHTMETYLTWLEVLDESSVTMLQLGQKGDGNKVVCYCPVELYVYDSNGNMVGKIEEGGYAQDFTEDGTGPALYYDEENGGKCVWLPKEGGYYVEAEPYDDGEMDIAWYGEAAVDESVDVARYNDMALESGRAYRIAPKEAAEGSPVDETVAITDPDGNEVNASYVASADEASSTVDLNLQATEGGEVYGGGQVSKGEHVTISAVPDNHYAFAGWYENDELVEGAEASFNLRVDNNRTLKAHFEPMQLPDQCTVELSSEAFTFNGEEQAPSIVVKDGNNELTENVDYEISWPSGALPGVYTGAVEFIGDYDGLSAQEFSWKILPQATTQSELTGGNGWLKVSWKARPDQATSYEIQLSTSSKFNAGLKAIVVKGKSANTKKVTGLAAGKKYWVRVRLINEDNGKVQGAWSKAKTRYAFEPKSMKVAKLKPSKKSMTVKWKKLPASQASGYEIQYGVKSNFAGAKTLVVKKAGAASAKIKKLKPKKKYFVRIRAYKTLEGTKYVGPWSAPKKVKAK